MKVSANQCVRCKKYDDDLDTNGVCFNCEEDFNNAADDYYENEHRFFIEHQEADMEEDHEYEEIDRYYRPLDEEEGVNYFSHYDNEEDYHGVLASDDLLEHIPFDLEESHEKYKNTEEV